MNHRGVSILTLVTVRIICLFYVVQASFFPFLKPASVAQVDLVAGAAVALPVVPIPIG